MIMEERQWNETEIRELILYAKHLQGENADLQAKMIMMDAKLRNEEAKVKKLSLQLYNILNQQWDGTNN
jgi:hypothetical protein